MTAPKPALRQRLATARALVACSLMFAGLHVGCQANSDGPSPVASYPTQSYQLGVDGGVAVCYRPDEGCSCVIGAAAQECVPDPRLGETDHCVSGQRFCRGGAWTACIPVPQSIIASTGASSSALVSGPSQCNPCDPRCFATHDVPSEPADLVGRSGDVGLDPVGGGVELVESTSGGTPLVDSDGDGVADPYDTFPMDPTRDGFTDEGGIFHQLAPAEAAGPDPLSISTTIRSADIYILMDTTGSMDGEIANLRSSLLHGNYLAASVFDPVTPNAPLPESFATAYDLGTDPIVGMHPVLGSTATMLDDVTGSGCNGAGRDAVVRFTITARQGVSFEAVNTWDSVLSLRRADYSEVVCDDDGGSGVGSRIETTLDPGTYYVVLESFLGQSQGSFELRAEFNGGTACDGVLGAINCIIPDAWFGVGWFQEYPRWPYGVAENRPYIHTLDITNNFANVQTAVDSLATRGNYDWPESMTQALYSAATGNGLGSIWPARDSNPSFAACANGRWGYPCFRDGAIPIIIGFTDAPSHEAPDVAYHYSFDDRWPSVGSVSVTNNNTQGSAYNMGDLTTLFGSASQRIVTGSTSSRSDSYSSSIVGCNGTGRDAVFRFTITQPRTVMIAAHNSAYDTVLSLFSTSISSLTRVTCNDNMYHSIYSSQIAMDLLPGVYYLVVDGVNGTNGNYQLTFGGRTATDGSPPRPSAEGPVYWPYTASALSSRGVKFVGIRSCNPASTDLEGIYCDATADHLRAVGYATNSVDENGNPFVSYIANDGSGLSSAVVSAVQRLTGYSRMNIEARARDNPATPFDERNFVASISITDCPASRCGGPRSGATCGQCLPGSNIGFDAVFQNTGVDPTGVALQPMPQVFDFWVDLIGDGNYTLDSVPVRIVIPPQELQYVDQGYYERDIDASSQCGARERPDWGMLTWDGDTPSGTSIDFELYTAESAASLDTTTPTTVISVPANTSPLDVGAWFASNGLVNLRPYVRVRAVLRTNAGRNATPTLRELGLSYTCLPSE